MANSKNNNRSWQEKATGVFGAIGEFFCSVGHIFKVIGTFLFRMRKIFMAIPVVLAAMRLAKYCQQELPDTVGIWLLENGDYAQMVSRETAILLPFGITLGCLVLMFCSRKTLYPWLISIFSLVLPVLIVVSNIFPS